MSNQAYVNSQGSTGTTTATAPSGLATWNLTSLIISQSGPSAGPNAKVTIYDGAVGGTVLYAAYLGSPRDTAGSVGIIQDIPLPRSPDGTPGIQATPGNAMNIQVTGTGTNQVSINARLSDGMPSRL